MSDGTLTKGVVHFTVSMHPALAADPAAGVQELLNTQLLRYSEELQGVVLACGRTKILSQKAPVQPYFPYLHMEARAVVTLFQPRPGARLVGVVNKIGRDFLGLLVAGVVNVAVPVARVRKDLVSRPADHCWASQRHPDHTISVGTHVVFDVTSVTQAGQFVSLEGSLTHPGTGALDWVRAHPQEAAVPGPDTPGVNGGTPPKKKEPGSEKGKKEPGSEKGKKEKKRKRHPDVPTPVAHSTDKKKKKTKPAQ